MKEEDTTMITNEVRHIASPAIVGLLVIRNPQMISDDTIVYSGTMSEVFSGHEVGTPAPSIRPNVTAFSVAVYNEDKLIDAFTAVVTSVRDYAVTSDTDDFRIRFKYTRVEGVPLRKVTRIDPVISHIVSEMPFICLVIEGEPNTVKRYIYDRLNVFYHGDTTYYKQTAINLSRRLDSSNLHSVDASYTTVGVAVIGCAMGLPDADEMSRFTDNVLAYLGYPTKKDSKEDSTDGVLV